MKTYNQSSKQKDTTMTTNIICPFCKKIIQNKWFQSESPQCCHRFHSQCIFAKKQQCLSCPECCISIRKGWLMSLTEDNPE